MLKPVVCEGCKVFAADCTTPVGDGASELCWLCAHDVMEHERELASLGKPDRKFCNCTREQIYPARVLEERASRSALEGARQLQTTLLPHVKRLDGAIARAERTPRPSDAKRYAEAVPRRDKPARLAGRTLHGAGENLGEN